MADRILDKTTEKPSNFQEFRKRILPRIDKKKREFPSSKIFENSNSNSAPQVFEILHSLQQTIPFLNKNISSSP